MPISGDLGVRGKVGVDLPDWDWDLDAVGGFYDYTVSEVFSGWGFLKDHECRFRWTIVGLIVSNLDTFWFVF